MELYNYAPIRQCSQHIARGIKRPVSLLLSLFYNAFNSKHPQLFYFLYMFGHPRLRCAYEPEHRCALVTLVILDILLRCWSSLVTGYGMGLSQGTQFRLSAFEPHDDLVVRALSLSSARWGSGWLGFRQEGSGPRPCCQALHLRHSCP